VASLYRAILPEVGKNKETTKTGNKGPGKGNPARPGRRGEMKRIREYVMDDIDTYDGHKVGNIRLRIHPTFIEWRSDRHYYNKWHKINNKTDAISAFPGWKTEIEEVMK